MSNVTRHVSNFPFPEGGRQGIRQITLGRSGPCARIPPSKLMLYCPRCNNTHWSRVQTNTFRQALLNVTLRNRYRCMKCEKVVVASMFTDMQWPRLRSRKKRKRKATQQQDPACPSCGKTATRRSRRKGLERLFPFWRAYRCTDCDHRFKVFALMQ